MSINRVNISGNLTRDPEVRSTPSGTQVLTMGVAVNDRRRDPQTGEWKDYPNYIDCVVFGNRAEALSRILRKGQKVAIEGKLRWSQWQDRETGKNRSKIEVIVDEVEFLSSRQGQPAGQAPAYSAPAQQAPAQQAGGVYGAAPAPMPSAPVASAPQASRPVQTPPSEDVYDEDIPF